MSLVISPPVEKRTRTRRIVLGIGGLLGTLLFIGAVFIAAYAYVGADGETFSFFRHYVSELGRYSVSPQALTFNVLIIIGAFLMVPFFIELGQFLATSASKFMSSMGIITAVSIAFIGAFSMDTPAYHKRAATVFFLASFIAFLTFALETLSHLEHGEHVPVLTLVLIGIHQLVSFLFLGVLVADWSSLDHILFQPATFVRPQVWWMATMEWGIFLGLMVLFMGLSLEMLIANLSLPKWEIIEQRQPTRELQQIK